MADEMTPEARRAFLASGTRTAILATTRADGHPFAFVMIDGTAELSPGPDDIDRVAPEIAQRYDGPDGVEEFVRFAHEGLGTLVRVKPTKIVALDRVGEH